MALKPIVDSADLIPEGLASYYQEKDGKFHLSLDGEFVPKSQVTEFRNNNIQLMKKQEELADKLKQFDGVDLVVYQEALKTKQALEDQKLLDSGKLEELVEKRVERMKADFEGKSAALNSRIEDISTENAGLITRLSSVLIDSQIQQAVNDIGKPREGAIQDILNRGRSLFKLIDGKPTPVGPDGNPIFGKDGKAPMTFYEWAQGLQETAGFLFESASGGGSTGGRQSAGGPIKTIAAGDPVAFGANLEAIASGKVAVVR